MDSDATPVSTRKRKSTSSSVVDTTPKEPKRRRASAKVDDLPTQAPLTVPKTVGRKRKAAADAVSDAGSVDGSVDSELPLRRSSRKRVSNDNISISSIPSIDSNDDLRETEPRSTRRSSARRKQVAETPPQASDTEDNFSIAESEAESIVQAPPSQRASSRPSLPLPVPAAPPAPTPRSASKRKSLSSGIAAVSVGVDTPGKQSIVHSFSPTATTPAHPRTPGITNENTTMQVAAAEEFSPNRGRPAEPTAHPAHEFKLEDSNDWYSWLSAVLLIALTLGSFYWQLSMPSHQFRPPVPTVAAPSHPTLANHTVLVHNVSSPAAVSWDLPNVTHMASLREAIREEKQRSEELLQRLADLSKEEAMISTLVELQETVQGFVEAAHDNLSVVESTLLQIEADEALVPEDHVPMTGLPSAETFFDALHDIVDDPVPIQEVIEGETKHEYRHQTDGLTPAEYEQTVQRQMAALVEHVRHETDEVLAPSIKQLQEQFQNHESIGDTATVEQVVESVLSDLSGETVTLPTTAAAPVDSLTLPAMDDVLQALEDAVAERERAIAQQVQQRDEVIEAQLRTVIGAAVEYVIEGDKDSLLRRVVESSAASVQEKINRMPKLDYLMEKEDEEEEDADEQDAIVAGDAEATAALLATADDVASSATGARMTLLESSTYCVKQKGDPISCASAHLRTVNSYAPINDANDCYAFEKLHKHDALTVQFFRPSTVVGFGLSHYISTDTDTATAAAAATTASYSVDCAPKDVYFTMHQSVSSASATATAAADGNALKPRGAFGKLLKPKGHFVSIDSGNYTFAPLSENVLREHVQAQGYTASQSFALSAPVSDVAKVTLHVRSTHSPSELSSNPQSMACVYRLKVFALPTVSA
eukprot:gene919-661_t